MQVITNLLHVPAHHGKTLQVFADQVTLLATGQDTAGAYTLISTTVPALSGPPPHVHHREEESFYVLEGEFEFHIGEEVIYAGPGDYLLAPRDIGHTFVNVTTCPGRLLVLITPAGFEGFFEEIHQLSAQGPPDLSTAMGVAQKYGLEFLLPSS
jgi:quercetin dioxygenase-like cupin family protein